MNRTKICVREDLFSWYTEKKILCASHGCFTLISFLVYSSTLKMESIYSFETWLDFHRTTRNYISEDRIISNHRCENLKSYIINILHASSFLLVVCFGLLFDPEDGDSTSLRNVITFLSDCTVSHTRWKCSSRDITPIRWRTGIMTSLRSRRTASAIREL
jgi:hypothetical protein